MSGIQVKSRETFPFAVALGKKSALHCKHGHNNAKLTSIKNYCILLVWRQNIAQRVTFVTMIMHLIIFLGCVVNSDTESQNVF